ncbi:hypothetical protein Ahy_A02g008209 isoform B [Arachis hypogaea]|uniref:Uncharacterized protein n=1 Tax=Arachis hypogaea TaxID=3818 RepID=A0A445EDX5_ARAHY|nr:hypothetical protein Ahy_A02g008209 isoform B [Arachis hypogaea]
MKETSKGNWQEKLREQRCNSNHPLTVCEVPISPIIRFISGCSHYWTTFRGLDLYLGDLRC